MLSGRILSFRVAGPKLVFIDIFQQECRVQGLCDFERISHAGVPLEDFKQFYHSLQRGDIFSRIQHLYVKYYGILLHQVSKAFHIGPKGDNSLCWSPKFRSCCHHAYTVFQQTSKTRRQGYATDTLISS